MESFTWDSGDESSASTKSSVREKKRSVESVSYSVSVSVKNTVGGNSIMDGQWECVQYQHQVFLSGADMVS